MKILNKVLIALLIILPSILPAQELLKLASEVYKAADELNGAYETLKTVDGIVKKIEKGEKPDNSGLGNDYSALAASYKKAAETLKNAKLPTEFDKTPYSITPTELSNCFNRAKNVKKINGYKDQLQKAVNECSTELTKVQKLKDRIQQTEDMLKYLIDMTRTLAETPIYKEIFQWDWYALETSVRHELATLSDAAKNHDEKLRAEKAKAEKHLDNLKSNLETFSGSYCSLEGVYKGASYDPNFIVILTLSKSGNSYSGTLKTVRVGEKSGVVRYIETFSLSGDKITMSAIWYYPGSNETTNYSGSVNSSFTTIKLANQYGQFTVKK